MVSHQNLLWVPNDEQIAELEATIDGPSLVAVLEKYSIATRAEVERICDKTNWEKEFGMTHKLMPNNNYIHTIRNLLIRAARKFLETANVTYEQAEQLSTLEEKRKIWRVIAEGASRARANQRTLPSPTL
ncbi:MAG: hypothetical protein O2904_01990 [bacterium]|nr:hypothetical protein [bacterium]